MNDIEEDITQALNIYNTYDDKYDNGVEIYTALMFFKTEEYNEPLRPETEQAIIDIKRYATEKNYVVNNKVNDDGIKFYNSLLDALNYIISN